jgi:hypothetical protein
LKCELRAKIMYLLKNSELKNDLLKISEITIFNYMIFKIIF